MQRTARRKSTSISRLPAAAACVVAMALAGCGAGGTTNDDAVAAAGTQAAGTHSTGRAIIAGGEYPFDPDERCYENPQADTEDLEETGAPGCLGEGAPLAGAGAVFVGQEVEVRYRGGLTVRDVTDDSANPESLFALALFDVTGLADNQLEVGLSGPELPSVGVVTVSEWGGSLDGCARGSVMPHTRTAQETYLDPGTTVTVAYCFATSGPAEFLEGDPILQLGGDGVALLALRDQDVDDETLEDLHTSIEMIAEVTDASVDETGMTLFTDRFGDIWEGAEPLTSEDRREASSEAETDGLESPDGGASNVEDEGSGTEAGQDSAAVEPPPPPPPPPESDEADSEVAEDPTAGPVDDSAVPSVDAWDPFEAAFLLFENDLPAGEFFDYCATDPQGAYPCLEVASESDTEAVVGVRVHAGGQDPEQRDVWIRLTSSGPDDGWTLGDRWDVGDGSTPPWVP